MSSHGTEEDSFPRSLWQCRYKIWKQMGIMTFASSWTRLQGSWFPSAICVSCSQSIGNAITADRLMQRHWLLRRQCNREIGRYIQKHRPKFNLPVASHLFLLIFFCLQLTKEIMSLPLPKISQIHWEGWVAAQGFVLVLPVFTEKISTNLPGPFGRL